MRRGLAAGLVAAALLVSPAGPLRAADPGDDGGAEPGPAGLLWGRLAVEEESPDGAWTPLHGVEVWVYPDAPEVRAELERVRRTARDGVSQFETAVQRVQGTLRGYRTRLEAAQPGSGRSLADPSTGPAGEAGVAAGTGPEASPGVVRRAVTDPAGLFVFDDLAAGEWLVVAIRTGPYAPAARERGPARGRDAAFLPPRTRGAVQQAELWLATVMVRPGVATRLFLTDRARWLVGPLR